MVVNYRIGGHGPCLQRKGLRYILSSTDPLRMRTEQCQLVCFLEIAAR